MADPMPEDERDALAAELALGLLDGAERADALRLCLSDRTFADQVEAWTVRLAPLFDEIAGAPAPPAVWQAIDARIRPTENRGSVRRVRMWRAAAFGSGAIAASLALYLAISGPFTSSPVSSPEPIAVAQLLDGKGHPVVTAAFDAGKGVLRLRSQRIETAALAPELWVIPADGVPRSLGLIPSSGASDVAITPALRAQLHQGATLAITAEDRATAPHDAPTSTPIMAGKISSI